MAGRLQGKIALITGASRGIGAATAAHMAREGATVVISSRKQDALDLVVAQIKQAYPQADVRAKACHVGKPEQRDALFEWLDDTVGTVDVLVNNAGTNVHFGPFMTLEERAWDKTFEINLKGPFAMSCAVARRLVDADRGGSIINVTSVLGQGAAMMQGVYGMSKAALISMTQTMAHEWGPANIRVNAIAPGLVETKLAAAIVQSPALMQQVTSRTANTRHAQPDELSGAAVFLASDEASYVTGTVLNVDGGYHSS